MFIAFVKPKVVLQRMRLKSIIPKPDKARPKPEKDELKPEGTLTYLKDDWVRAIGIPGFGLSIPSLTGLFGDYTWRDEQTWLGYVYFIFLAFVIWQGNRYMLFSQRSYYSWFSKPWIKIFLMVFANVYYTVPVTVLMLVFWYMYSGLPAIDWDVIVTVSLTNVICVLFVTHIYETVFLIKERESDLVRMERLERTKAQAELEALKYQIDPHFMFNSLNTLSHLIESNPKNASKFNERLAEVYRYILSNKDRNLVFLEEELAFLDDYFELFKLRFGEAIHMTVDIPKREMRKFLSPPISLQILLENCIKHNSFTKRAPLKIEVWREDNFLIISNNKKTKEVLNKNGIGLKNLSERYELLTELQPEIQEEDEFFRVKLPLLST